MCVPKDCKSHIVKDFSLKDKAFMSGTMDLNVISLGFGDKGKAPSCGGGWKAV